MRHYGTRTGARRTATTIAVTAVVTAALCAVAPLAMGAGPKGSSAYGYSGPAGAQSSLQPAAIKTPTGSKASQGTEASALPQATQTSTLPYTGADLVLIGGAGVLLIAFGASVYTMRRRPHPGT